MTQAHLSWKYARIGSSSRQGERQDDDRVGLLAGSPHSGLGTALEIAEKYPHKPSRSGKRLVMLTNVRQERSASQVNNEIATRVDGAIGSARERRRLENDVDEAKC